MRTFHYDKQLLFGIKSENVFDIGGVVIDLIIGLWFLKELEDDGHQYHAVFAVLLGAVLLYMVYAVARLVCRFLIASNIENERLEITSDGVNITFHEKVLVRESIRYVELYWSEIRSAEVIPHEFSIKNFRFLDLFKYREKYKTVQIYTARGLYKVFIEDSYEAVSMINDRVNPTRETEDYSAGDADEYAYTAYADPVEDSVSSVVHKWRCSCGKMISQTPCPYCGKGATEETVMPDDHWKCMGCGEILPNSATVCECGYKRK